VIRKHFIDAEEYLSLHELDMKNSRDLAGEDVVESPIPVEMVRKTREALAMPIELFATLMGVKLPDMIRYENLGVPPFPQGAFSRKMAFLINWMADETSCAELRNLLKRANGLPTLSGLLQTESVAAFLSMSSAVRDEDFSMNLSPFRRRDRNLMDA
jgi:hypothetical protein